MERVSQAYEFSHSNFNRTTRYIHFDEQKSVYGPLEHVGKGRWGCERTRRTPSPYGSGFCKWSFYYIGIHADSYRKCIGKSRFLKTDHRLLCTISFRVSQISVVDNYSLSVESWSIVSCYFANTLLTNHGHITQSTRRQIPWFTLDWYSLDTWPI